MNFFVDSDDESEQDIVREINNGGGLAPFMVDKALTSVIEEKLDVRTALGWMMHYYADRFLRHNSEVVERYNKLKQENFASSAIDANHKFVQVTNDFLKTDAAKDLLQIGIEDIGVEDSIRLFNHLFNKKIPLPNGLSYKTSQDKQKLLEKLAKNTEYRDVISSIFPIKQSGLTLKPENAIDVFAANKLVGRFSKNQLKAMLIKSQYDPQGKINISINLELHNQQAYALQEQLTLRTDTRKVQADIVNQGNYQEIFKVLTEANKSEVISRMKRSITGRKLDDNAQDQSENSSATDKLTQLLFFVEPERNKSTIFANIMLFDSLEKKKLDDVVFGMAGSTDTKTNIINAFPMAMSGATSATRSLSCHTIEHLPALDNSHHIDYSLDKVALSAQQLLLQLSGDLWCTYDEKLNSIRSLLQLLITKPSTNVFVNHLKTAKCYVGEESSKVIEDLNKTFDKHKLDIQVALENKNYQGVNDTFSQIKEALPQAPSSEGVLDKEATYDDEESDPLIPKLSSLKEAIQRLEKKIALKLAPANTKPSKPLIDDEDAVETSKKPSKLAINDEGVIESNKKPNDEEIKESRSSRQGQESQNALKNLVTEVNTKYYEWKLTSALQEYKIDKKGIRDHIRQKTTDIKKAMIKSIISLSNKTLEFYDIEDKLEDIELKAAAKPKEDEPDYDDKSMSSVVNNKRKSDTGHEYNEPVLKGIALQLAGEKKLCITPSGITAQEQFMNSFVEDTMLEANDFTSSYRQVSGLVCPIDENI